MMSYTGPISEDEALEGVSAMIELGFVQTCRDENGEFAFAVRPDKVKEAEAWLRGEDAAPQEPNK